MTTLDQTIEGLELWIDRLANARARHERKSPTYREFTGYIREARDVLDLMVLEQLARNKGGSALDEKGLSPD